MMSRSVIRRSAAYLGRNENVGFRALISSFWESDLNVNIRLDGTGSGLPDNVGDIAFAKRQAIILSRLRVMEDLVDAIRTVLSIVIREGFALIRKDRWLRHCDMVGQPLRVVFKEDIQIGQMLGIDEDGSLLLGDGQK